MILNDIETAVFSDYKYWVFAYLPKPQNGVPGELRLSKVYPANTNEIPLIGTVVAMIMHSHPNVDFKLMFG